MNPAPSPEALARHRSDEAARSAQHVLDLHTENAALHKQLIEATADADSLAKQLDDAREQIHALREQHSVAMVNAAKEFTSGMVAASDRYQAHIEALTKERDHYMIKVERLAAIAGKNAQTLVECMQEFNDRPAQIEAQAANEQDHRLEAIEEAIAKG